jgi:aryl-alcohol dehydrogenase-like predicted oxidoreductase
VEVASLNEDFLAFFDAGITTLDCADIYTGVEAIIGDFRRHLANERGVEAQARLKVHTKFVPDLDLLPRLSFADVEAIINRSLSRLGMERLDLVQFHWWDTKVPGAVAAALHLKSLQQAGKIAHVAGTNFDAAHLRAFAEPACRSPAFRCNTRCSIAALPEPSPPPLKPAAPA